MIYLDTSAAVKRLLGEEGADRVSEVFRGDVPRVSSKLLAVEAHSVAHRRRLPSSWMDAFLTGVDLVSIDDTIANRAIELRSGLRTLDALHLATAITLAPLLTGFLSFDDELNAAAARVGLPVL